MNNHKRQPLHHARHSSHVGTWIVISIGVIGMIAALMQQSSAGLITAGIVAIVIAKHAAIVGVVLGPLRLAWRKLTGRRAQASEERHLRPSMNAAKIADDALMANGSRQAVGIIGHRLLTEFRTQTPDHHAAVPLPDEKSKNNVPDMAFIEALASRLGQWENLGQTKSENLMAVAGLLVAATYGIAAIEAQMGDKIMDEAVDGFAGVIWSGIQSGETAVRGI